MMMSLPRGLILCACVAGCSGGGSSSPEPNDPPPNDPPPEPPPEIAHERAFENLSFDRPVVLLQRTGDPTIWYVAEQPGRVLRFDNEASAASSEVILDIRDRVVSSGELGLLGLAFSPDFTEDRRLYASYTIAGPVSVVSRFVVDEDGQVDVDSEEVLLEVPQDFGNHNGGHLLFGPDGFLYIGFGDGGSANDPNNRAQDTTTLFGTLLRIDVSADAGYEVPQTNPFFGNARCEDGFGDEDCPEIFAFGLRNPWRFSFDSLTGDLWVGDVGQGDFEEVNRVVSGGNYGWRLREGAHCNPNLDEPECMSDEFIDPVFEYSHDLGQSVTGGFVYRGGLLDRQGTYIGGDFVSGIVFTHDESTGEFEVALETDTSISSFAEDDAGEIHFFAYGRGHIHRLVTDP